MILPNAIINSFLNDSIKKMYAPDEQKNKEIKSRKKKRCC